MSRPKKIRSIKNVRDTYAYIADGNTEKWYLTALKRANPQLRFDLKPEFGSKKDVEDQYKLAIELSKSYSGVLWIIDIDTFIKEDNEKKKGFRSSLDKLKECIRKVKSKNEKEKAKKKGNDYKPQLIHIIANSPCLEIWYLLHYSNGVCKDYKAIEKELRKIPFLKKYEKSEKYYMNPRNNIYQRLRPNLQEALNRTKNHNFDPYEISNCLSEMRKIFKELGLCDDRYDLKDECR